MLDSSLTTFAVFGNPIDHSLSPLMHQAAIKRMHLKAQYVPFCVTDLKNAVEGIRRLDIRGVSVTLPFKTEVMDYLDEVEESALRIGAVNTIWNHEGKLKGYNTDWLGFVLSLKDRMEIKDKRFIVLGAGGAARGIIYGLVKEGGHPIILNRTLSKAEALGKEFGCLFVPESERDKIAAEGLINTTSLGMSPDKGISPFPKELLNRFQWVVDIIYNPFKTKLMREAEEAGCQTISGLGMFVHQGAEQIKIWTGLEPPRGYMMEVVGARLKENDRDVIEIRSLSQLTAQVTIPGSKSYTQRAMIMAALAEGESHLQGPLLSEDTKYLADALRLLGADIEVHGGDMSVQGTSGRIQNPQKEIYLGNNGTAMRLLTTVVCLGKGEYHLTGAPRLLERPVQPLLAALNNLGVKALSRDKQGFPPVMIQAEGLQGGKVTFSNIDSSQYISSLLISAPFARGDFTLELQGSIPSLPYVAMTTALMKRFGAEVIQESPSRFLIKNMQKYKGISCRIEGDVSSASYFFLAAALARSRVRVQPILPDTIQGDIRFLNVLEELGCHVLRGDHWVEVLGGKLIPGETIFDFKDMPDMVPTLAVLAACRPGKTIIKNIAHLRIKESNRLEALVRELTKTGIQAVETEDGLIIEGGLPHRAEIETYNDHRIAMSFAILGLIVPGMTIKDPDCVQKSFPGFWRELKKLY